MSWSARPGGAGAALRSRALATGRVPKAGAWAKLSERYRNLAEVVSGRECTVVVSPGAGRGHPGYSMAAAGYIGVDGKLLGGDPTEAAKAGGAIREGGGGAVLHGVWWHELGHVMHSGGLPKGLDARLAGAVALLEEARMEGRILDERPDARPWIRASFKALLKEPKTAAEAYGAAGRVAALVCGREIAGVLDAGEADESARLLVDAVGDGAAGRLLGAVRAGVEAGDDEVAGPLVDAARELLAVLDEIAAARDEERGSSEAAEAAMEAAMEAAAEAVAEAGASEAEATGEVAPGDEADGGSVETERRGEMDAPKPGGHGRGSGGHGGWEWRDPSAAERSLRHDLARALERARFRERDVSLRCDVVPPGRLRGGAAVQAAALAARGGAPEAATWRRKVRKVVPSPTLRVAVLADTSGSMSWLAGDVSGAVWAIVGAVEDRSGRALAVAFDTKATLISEPGRPMRQVADLAATGAWEAAGDAIDLARFAMAGGGAGEVQVVVVLSDGQLVQPDQAARYAAGVAWLRTQGTKVVIVHHKSRPVTHGEDVAIVLESPGDLAGALGAELVGLLSTAA